MLEPGDPPEKAPVEQPRKRRPIQPGDGDPRHGTENGYGYHKCRCEECTDAHRAKQREYLHADPVRMERHRERQRLRRARGVVESE